MEIPRSLLDTLEVFEKMYDVVRIVDPVRKEVLNLEEQQLLATDVPCYELWKKMQFCENCISIRANNENEIAFKLEYIDNLIYVFTAIPVVIEGKKLVVEFLKEVTNSFVMSVGGDFQKAEKIVTMIEDMNRMAVRDSLTDLYNRRYIDERLPVDLLNASTKNEPLSIILVDLDHFKDINDTYGHVAGDQVLKEFAEELKAYIRKGTDWVARYGGEEFLICLSNTDIDAAKQVAERIRSNIEKKEFIINDKAIHITCSLGVHMIHGETEDMTFDHVIELVDKRLYQAKKLGRNIVK